MFKKGIDGVRMALNPEKKQLPVQCRPPETTSKAYFYADPAQLHGYPVYLRSLDSTPIKKPARPWVERPRSIWRAAQGRRFVNSESTSHRVNELGHCRIADDWAYPVEKLRIRFRLVDFPPPSENIWVGKLITARFSGDRRNFGRIPVGGGSVPPDLFHCP